MPFRGITYRKKQTKGIKWRQFSLLPCLFAKSEAVSKHSVSLWIGYSETRMTEKRFFVTLGFWGYLVTIGSVCIPCDSTHGHCPKITWQVLYCITCTAHCFCMFLHFTTHTSIFIHSLCYKAFIKFAKINNFDTDSDTASYIGIAVNK